MAVGGKRPGAGRKPGSRNKSTVAQREAAAASGLTPLDYMLSILRDENQEPAARFAAAEKAAPYCHAKLAAVTVGGDPDAPIQVQVIKRVIVDPGNRDT